MVKQSTLTVVAPVTMSGDNRYKIRATIVYGEQIDCDRVQITFGWKIGTFADVKSSIKCYTPGTLAYSRSQAGRRPYPDAMEDNTVEQNPSPDTPIENSSNTIPPDAGRQMAASVVRWGTSLGMLVGGTVGTVIGLLLASLSGSMVALGLGVGLVVGFILGLAIALVDGLALVRYLHAIATGRTQPSVASAVAATVSVILVFALALFLLDRVWHDVLSDSFILIPTLFLALVTWGACNWVDIRVINAALSSPSSLAPLSSAPR